LIVFSLSRTGALSFSSSNKYYVQFEMQMKKMCEAVLYKLSSQPFYWAFSSTYLWNETESIGMSRISYLEHLNLRTIPFTDFYFNDTIRILSCVSLFKFNLRHILLGFKY
jgi:hypothetical protein